MVLFLVLNFLCGLDDGLGHELGAIELNDDEHGPKESLLFGDDGVDVVGQRFWNAMIQVSHCDFDRCCGRFVVVVLQCYSS